MSGDNTFIGNISGGYVQTGKESTMTVNKTVKKSEEIETKTLGGEKAPPRVKKSEKILIIIGLLAIIVAIIVGWKEEIVALLNRIL